MALGDTREESIREFLGPLEPNFPIVKLKDENRVANAYDIRAIPHNVIIDTEGRVIESRTGAYGEDEWKRQVLPHIAGAS